MNVRSCNKGMLFVNKEPLFFNKDLLLINNGRKIIPTLGIKFSHAGTKLFPRWDWIRFLKNRKKRQYSFEFQNYFVTLHPI